MIDKTYTTEWDYVVNLGIKCNVVSISRAAAVRYYSSPFDNIDTVDGLVDCARLMASHFRDHMVNIQDWRSVNVLNKNGEIVAKSLTHVNVPNIQYPHFYEGWSGGALTKEDVKRWIETPDAEISYVWEYFSKTFVTRQERLISWLKARKKILFLRVDTHEHASRVFRANQISHVREFTRTMKDAFPQVHIGLLYFYFNNDRYARKFVSSGNFCAELIPNTCCTKEDVDAFVCDRLKRLKLVPRSTTAVAEQSSR